MASGQPQCSSRILKPTIASARTKATISSQVVGEPQSENAGAKKSMENELRLVRCELDEDLVGLDHAELAARLFFDHLQSFFQVAYFRTEAFVGELGGGVFGGLQLQFVLQLCHVGQAAATKPQLRVHDCQQHQQNGRNHAATHERIPSAPTQKLQRIPPMVRVLS